jgi:Protein of unknown function (DUF3592)
MESPDVLSLLPPPPRRIRRRRGYLQIFFNHLFLIFLLMFASLFWQISVGVVRLLWFSTLVPAKVTKILVTPGEPGPSYDLLITYRFGEGEYSEKVNIGPREAGMLKEGDTVQVQVLPERPDRGQLYRENYPYVLVTTLLCLFTLGPTVGLTKMLWNLYVSPWKVRRLMREGAAASAVILDKKQIAGRPPTYTVSYEYPVPSDGVAGLDASAPVTLRASMKVPADDFHSARVGDNVMVLYRPERPRRSIIYRYADYEFAEAGPTGSVRQTLPSENPLIWPWVVVIVTAGLLLFGILSLLGW